MIKQILFFGNQVNVSCDQLCSKAWGYNCRPVEQDANGNYWYLADGELGRAPADPGTREGRDSKPDLPTQFPNRWCVRECERSVIVDLNKEVALPDFSKRQAL